MVARDDAGMLAVALTPTIQLAAVCSAYLYALFNLFAGYSITQPNMPGWWYVLSCPSPVSLTSECLEAHECMALRPVHAFDMAYLIM